MNGAPPHTQCVRQSESSPWKELRTKPATTVVQEKGLDGPIPVTSHTSLGLVTCTPYMQLSMAGVS